METNSKNKIFLIIIIILILLVFVITMVSLNKSSIIQKPNINEIKEIIQNENVIMIDVRTKVEYDSGHIKGAINIPDTEIANTINYDKNKTIAVYCRTGKRSSAVAKKLVKLGYTKIYDLGGIENMNIELTTD